MSWKPPDEIEISLSADQSVSPAVAEAITGKWTYLLATPERQAAGEMREALEGLVEKYRSLARSEFETSKGVPAWIEEDLAPARAALEAALKGE